jgi:alkylation response protein AidB-like acyl-CoA dehydrogenase
MRKRFHYSWEGFVPELNKMLADAKLLYLGLPKDVGGRGLVALCQDRGDGCLRAPGL